jgi:hypothetical protein
MIEIFRHQNEAKVWNVLGRVRNDADNHLQISAPPSSIFPLKTVHIILCVLNDLLFWLLTLRCHQSLCIMKSIVPKNTSMLCLLPVLRIRSRSCKEQHYFGGSGAVTSCGLRLRRPFCLSSLCSAWIPASAGEVWTKNTYYCKAVLKILPDISTFFFLYKFWIVK